MPIGTPEPETFRTKLHQELVRRVELAGYTVQEELDYPPYRVDVYVPQFHVALEADGPLHRGRATMRKDVERDDFLRRRYQLPVIRFTEEEIKSDFFRASLDQQLYAFASDSDERRRQAEIECPWL